MKFFKDVELFEDIQMYHGDVVEEELLTMSAIKKSNVL